MKYPITEDDINLYRGYGTSASGKFKIIKKSGVKVEANSYPEAEQLKQQILDDYGKAKKWDELQSRYAHIDFGEWLQDTKLRELIEKWNKDLLSAPLSVEAENWRDYEISDRIEELLRESKK